MTREVTCDVAVIGAGTAGLAARKAARAEGARTVLIERGPGGTTCARVGCMPSKLLIAAARAAHDARGAGLFGIEVPRVEVDGRRVLARMRAERDRFVSAVLADQDGIAPEERFEGAARFLGPTTLSVGEDVRVEARAVVIATGSSPALPPPLRDVTSRVLTTDTVFEIDALPETLAVLGGGPVGLELAQAFARLGVRVTLIDPSRRIGGLRDPVVADCAAELIGREVSLRLGSTVVGAELDGAGLRLRWEGEGGAGEARFAAVLAAAGRPPNLRDLALDRAGLSLDRSGMPSVDPVTLRCGDAPIFLAGDANGLRPVLHEAARQGEIAGRNAANPRAPGRPSDWPAFALVFTDPQIAVIGHPFDPEAAADWRIGEVSFADQGRARIDGRAHGMARLYGARDGRLIGAEMIGPAVEHLGHLLVTALREGWDAAAMLDRPFYHPTVEEGLTGALETIARHGRRGR
ncbi:dihydrolipoyl dehydrogenase [Methylobacterium sp. JK268]